VPRVVLVVTVLLVLAGLVGSGVAVCTVAGVSTAITATGSIGGGGPPPPHPNV
jgi:hypothetical protein